MDVCNNFLKKLMSRKCIDKGAFVEVFLAISKIKSGQFALPNERKYGCF